MNIIRSHKHEIYTETINKIALSSSDDKRIMRPDKTNTLPHGYRTGWHGKPTREPTGRQGNWQGRWQGDGGGDRVTGEATGWQGRSGKVTGELTGRQGRRQGDSGGLAKWGMNKSPLLVRAPQFGNHWVRQSLERVAQAYQLFVVYPTWNTELLAILEKNMSISNAVQQSTKNQKNEKE